MYCAWGITDGLSMTGWKTTTQSKLGKGSEKGGYEAEECNI